MKQLIIWYGIALCLGVFIFIGLIILFINLLIQCSVEPKSNSTSYTNDSIEIEEKFVWCTDLDSTSDEDQIESTAAYYCEGN